MAIDSNEVKVLGSMTSPFSARVRIALNLKGVEYEFLQEAFGIKSELLLKSNPVYKKFPVLIHNGKPISESMIIVQYIDEVWSSSGNAILPADPYDRAVSRFWATYIDDKWFPGIRSIIMAQTDEARAEAAEQLSAGLLLLEEAFEKCSNGGEFFGGENIGYVDIALGCHLNWLEAVGKISGVEFLGEGKAPLLDGWAERFRAMEAMKGLMSDVTKLLEVAKMMNERHRVVAPAN